MKKIKNKSKLIHEIAVFLKKINSPVINVKYLDDLIAVQYKNKTKFLKIENKDNLRILSQLFNALDEYHLETQFLTDTELERYFLEQRTKINNPIDEFER